MLALPVVRLLDPSGSNEACLSNPMEFLKLSWAWCDHKLVGAAWYIVSFSCTLEEFRMSAWQSNFGSCPRWFSGCGCLPTTDLVCEIEKQRQRASLVQGQRASLVQGRLTTTR